MSGELALHSKFDLSVSAFHQTRQWPTAAVDPLGKFLLKTQGLIFPGVDAFAERGFSEAAFSGVVREAHARIKFMLSERDCDQFLNGLLKPLQIVPEQLVSNRLGDLLAFVDIRARVPVANSFDPAGTSIRL